MASSKLKLAILKVLKDEGYIADYGVEPRWREADADGRAQVLRRPSGDRPPRAHQPAGPAHLPRQGRAAEGAGRNGHRRRLDAEGRHDRQAGARDRHRAAKCLFVVVADRRIRNHVSSSKKAGRSARRASRATIARRRGDDQGRQGLADARARRAASRSSRRTSSLRSRRVRRRGLNAHRRARPARTSPTWSRASRRATRRSSSWSASATAPRCRARA